MDAILCTSTREPLNASSSPSRGGSFRDGIFDSKGLSAYYCAPMTESPVPDTLDARKVFVAGEAVKGSMPLRRLGRFVELLLDDSGEVSIDLACYIDEEQRRIIAGDLSADVLVRCQRCLETFRMPLREQFRLAVVASEAIGERLPVDIDPWVSEEPLLSLNDILEEQLLLAMPIVNRHAEGLCEAGPANYPADEPNESKEGDNPFAVLKQLKTDH